MTAQSTGDWHADDVALQEFCDGTVGPVMGASVESHVMHCSPCRARLSAITAREPLDDMWLAIRERIESGGPAFIERLLQRMGMSMENSRLLAAVPALRAGWVLSISAALLFSGIAAVYAGTLGLSLFVLIAPLAPVAGVALAYGRDADPSYEVVTATPYSSGRLLCLRTVGVLVSTVPAAVLAGLVLPGPDWLALAWLGPAAAGVVLALLAAPRVGMSVASGTIGVCWVVATSAAARMHEPLVLVAPVMQGVFMLLTVAAVAALLVQRDTFDLPGRQS